MGIIHIFFGVILLALGIYFGSIAVQLIRMERLVEQKVSLLEEEIADVFCTHIPISAKGEEATELLIIRLLNSAGLDI